MSKRATTRPTRAVRDAIGRRNRLLFGLPIGTAPPPPVVVFWLHVLNGKPVLTREGSYSIAAAHNGMVKEALALPKALQWDYLTWLETDHTFNAWDVFPFIEGLDPKLYPIVNFLYVERSMPCLPVVFDLAEDGTFERWDEEKMAEVERRPGLHPVTGGVPMGVTAIHRSVFEALAEPWYYDPPDGSMSDDIWFCQQAIKAGFPVHVATQFDIGHWGSARYDRRHYWAGVEFDRKKVALAAEELLRKRVGESKPFVCPSCGEEHATEEEARAHTHAKVVPLDEGEEEPAYRDRRRVTA